MKKIILLIFLLSSALAIGNDEYAGNLEIVIEKQTNGSYIYELPKFSTEIKRNMFIYKPELSLVFTSERSEGLLKANHHSVRWNNNLGFKYKDIYCTNSIGLNYIFEGNDDNLDEGMDFFNTLTIGFQF